MDFQLLFKVNDKIFLRDPESSEVGKQIVKKAIDLIYELGFEQFTFKKLATEINSTEATVYRYFENKHRLLLYILNWYWSYMEYLVVFRLQNIHNKKEKLKLICFVYFKFPAILSNLYNGGFFYFVRFQIEGSSLRGT